MKEIKKAREKKFLEEKPLTAMGKLMTFFQVIASILIIIGLFTTLHYPLYQVSYFIKGGILVMTAIVSCGFLFFNDKYHSLWKNFDSHAVYDPLIFELGYFLYSMALFLSIITLLFFRFSKKNKTRRSRLIYSWVLFFLIIALFIVHYFVEKPHKQGV